MTILPEKAEWHYELAKTWYFLKNYERAKQELEKVHQINKNFKDADKLFELISKIEKEEISSSNDFLNAARQEKKLAKKFTITRKHSKRIPQTLKSTLK
ncbi:hypothetical protein ACFLRM_01465 [Acidobacteriota bacterium]